MSFRSCKKRSERLLQLRLVVTRSKTCDLAWKTCLRFLGRVERMMMRNLIEYYGFLSILSHDCAHPYPHQSCFLKCNALQRLLPAKRPWIVSNIREFMSEQPASIARYKRLIYSSPKVTHDRFCLLLFMSFVIPREARSIHQSLKELLKTKEPFDKEVDFQRKK